MPIEEEKEEEKKKPKAAFLVLSALGSSLFSLKEVAEVRHTACEHLLIYEGSLWLQFTNATSSSAFFPGNVKPRHFLFFSRGRGMRPAIRESLSRCMRMQLPPLQSRKQPDLSFRLSISDQLRCDGAKIGDSLDIQTPAERDARALFLQEDEV